MTPYQDKADKLRQMAHNLVDKIQGLRRNREEHTRKKAYQAAKARIEASHLDRVREACLALAFAYERQDLPPTMSLMKWTKETLLNYTATRMDTSGPYQTIRDTGEFADQCKMAVDLRLLIQEHRTDEMKARQAEHDRRERVMNLERATRLLQIPGFFPTPPAIISRMLDLACIFPPVGDHEPVLSVLEPSAGKGDIAEAVQSKGHYATCVEISARLCEILAAKDLNYMHRDFLELPTPDVTPGVGQFDRVVMNPPFEDHQAIDHIMHAYKFLRPGGILAASWCH